MKSLRISAVLAVIGVAAIVVAVAMLAGAAWGIGVFGGFSLAAAILLYDPKTRSNSMQRRGPRIPGQ